MTTIQRFPQLVVPPHINDIRPYEPGKPLDELAREYGVTGAIKLASNENPLGPSPKAVAAIATVLGDLHRYPDGGAYRLGRALAGHLGVPADSLVFGNGSDEVISMLTHALLLPGDEVVLPRPAFLLYEITTRSVGAVPVSVPLKDLAVDLDGLLDAVTPNTRMVFVNNPNNPTGTRITAAALARFLDNLPPRVLVVLDEAYIEFVDDPDCAVGTDFLDRDNPVVVLRTFSKAYGLAGLRVGYGIMSPEIRSLLNRIRMPFNLSIPAQAAAEAALGDAAFLEQTRAAIREGLAYLLPAIADLGLTVYPTHANFFMVDMRRPAAAVFEALLRRGVIVRSLVSYGFPQHIRVSVGLAEENKRLVAALADVCAAG